MTIDLRARVTCSLGDVISASISDSYIQGSGLVYTTGSCQVKGVVSPTTGSSIIFEYTKSGITRRIPRTMRVLSSFADPFRRVTDIELGCLLTYLSDLKDPVKLQPEDDPESADFTEEDAEIVTIPIHASSVMQKCLGELGISASSIPLTNKFSIKEFDISAGYVSVLSDLLVSESYLGYLDQNEILQIINLSEDGGSGPIIASEDLIDVGPIGVGELPGDAVVVKYSSLKLKLPEGDPLDEDKKEDPFQANKYVHTNVASECAVSYSATFGDEEVSLIAVYSADSYTYDQTLYATRQFENKEDPYGPQVKKSVVFNRTISGWRTAASVIGGIFSQWLSGGASVGNFPIKETTTEGFTYDKYGNEILKVVTKVGSELQIVGMMGIPVVFEDDNGNKIFFRVPNGSAILERTETHSYTIGEYTTTTTRTFGPWVSTPSGQQAIAESRAHINSEQNLGALLSYATAGIALIDCTTVSELKTEHGQFGPLPAEKANEDNADGGDPNNGYKTPSSSEVIVAEGDGGARRRVEFSLPYAPDDTFRKVGIGEEAQFFSTKSDAPQKAANFGRIQNRMLLGNRSGMSIQISPEKLPPRPFSAVFIEGAGTVALYRINAASWAIDSSGIVASTDAMFWGTAGSLQ